MLKPLSKGDLVAVAAPAKAVSIGEVQKFQTMLENKGFQVLAGENVTDEILLKLAGEDERRIQELNRFFRHSEVRAIFSVSGGYGCTRILSRLDYKHLRNHPKIICGYSDITALHMAVYVETGLVSFHSPNLDSHTRTKFTDDQWWNMLGGKLPEQIPLPDDKSYTGLETWNGGIGEGTLVGGNLSLIAALEGTPHAIPKDRDVILFLEDVGEFSYRIDWMLNQLRLAGSFENVKGVLLGQFTQRKHTKRETAALLKNTLQRFFQQFDIPVLANLPFGHVKNNITLAHGTRIRLDADQQVFTYSNPFFIE